MPISDRSIGQHNKDSNQYTRKEIVRSSKEKVKSSKESLTIIIPTFNENKNIIPLLKKVITLSKNWNIEILVILASCISIARDINKYS